MDRTPVSFFRLLGQYLQDAAPGGVLNPEVTPQGLLDATALATSPVPVVGDVAGLAADGYRMLDPEQRTPLNYGMMALGALPFVPSLSASTKLDDGLGAILAARAKKARQNASSPRHIGGLGLSPRNTAAQRMEALQMDRGWWRGGEAPKYAANTPASGQWFTRYQDQAEDYAKRAANPDVREYAIPKRTLDLMEVYPPEIARRIGAALEASGDDRVRAFGRQYLDAANKGESLPGRALFQGLSNTFGVDVASDILQKAGYSGVTNWNQAGDAFVFKGRPIRDANKAAFDPIRIGRDDIYGRADIGLMGIMAAGGLGAWLGSLAGDE